MNCTFCNTETNNPKFCSSSCAAKVNNVNIPKRQFTKSCKLCFTLIKKSRTYCKDCWINKPKVEYKDIPFAEAINNDVTRSGANALIRYRARATYPAGSCESCGYSKHYEVAHIKAISSFPLNTMVSIINDFSNLIRLCPNCHWEFDHLNSGAPARNRT